MRFVEEDPSWAMPTVPDVEQSLVELGTAGAVMDPPALHRLGVLLASSRAVADELASRGARYPELSTVRERMVTDQATESAIAKCVLPTPAGPSSNSGFSIASAR